MQPSLSTTMGSRNSRSLGSWAGTVLDFVYKPVYPSIYMLYRMYICWEHARFCVSLLCVVCSTAQSPNLALAGEGLQ